MSGSVPRKSEELLRRKVAAKALILTRLSGKCTCIILLIIAKKLLLQLSHRKSQKGGRQRDHSEWTNVIL